MQKRASLTHIFAAALLTILLYSCGGSIYPVNKPYVHKTKIIIEGSYPSLEKKELQTKLEAQLDDSLVPSRERKKILGVPYYVKRYHTYDTNNIVRTRDFFDAAYVANGYFRGGVTTDTVLSARRNPLRKTIIFTARPNKNHRIDTVIFDMGGDTTLQRMALEARGESFLEKNMLYSQVLLNGERDRLVNIFRNNGYLRFNKEDLKIVADTINPWLVNPTTDPFEMAENLEKAAEFNRNPTTDITVKLVDSTPAERLRQYYVGTVYIDPDNIEDDVIPPYRDTLRARDSPRPVLIIKQYFDNNIKNKIFRRNISLRKGELYRQDNYTRTLNNFNFLGPWQQVIVKPILDTINKTDTVSFRMLMLPHPKFQSERKIEGTINSYNSDNNLQLNNLFGISASQVIKNRNLAREAIQSSLSGRAGIELSFDNNLLNSFQGGFAYTMLFPEFKPPSLRQVFKGTTAQRSFLALNTSYTRRISFFSLIDVSASYGIQYLDRKRWNNQLTFPNFERKFLKPTDSLQRQIDQFPILAFIFNDGMVFGAKYNTTKALEGKTKNRTGSIRYAFEFSALPGIGKIKELRNNLFHFVRAEADWRRYLNRPTTSWAFRGFVGLGIPFDKRLPQNQHLPFFKQFTAGGPNSMRAWTIRNLSSYSTRTKAPDQRDFFGDIQVETNIEWRYTIGKLIGIPIKGAFFIDAGNIWNWTPYDPTLVPAGLSKAKMIYNDIAVAGGTSVRVDFNYFLIRLDFGMRLKDPDFADKNSGWFAKDNFNLSFNHLSPIKMQVGINYPF